MADLPDSHAPLNGLPSGKTEVPPRRWTGAEEVYGG
jgi:hypothetical protein